MSSCESVDEQLALTNSLLSSKKIAKLGPCLHSSAWKVKAMFIEIPEKYDIVRACSPMSVSDPPPPGYVRILDQESRLVQKAIILSGQRDAVWQNVAWLMSRPWSRVKDSIYNNGEICAVRGLLLPAQSARLQPLMSLQSIKFSSDSQYIALTH